MIEAVRAFAGPREADGYARLRDWLTRLHEVEYARFIAANVDSPLGLLTPRLARLAALGGFGRWDRAVGRFLRDERLRRIFTFQALYAGFLPARAPRPLRGDRLHGHRRRRVLPARRDARPARRPGRRRRRRPASTSATARPCPRWNAVGRRVAAVRTADGERITCDAVVLTCELHRRVPAARPHAAPAVRWPPAPSAVVVHLGLPAAAGDPTAAGAATTCCSAMPGGRPSPSSSATGGPCATPRCC